MTPALAPSSPVWSARAGEVAHPFSGVSAGKAARAVPEPGIGPGSNTGQKGGALVDYLTVVMPLSAVEARGLSHLPHLLETLFGFRGAVVNTAIRAKRWQYYPESACLVDREGEMVGRVGIGGNAETICISLSGAGTRWVRSWERAAHHLAALKARITRVDVAFDDYDGETLNVHDMRARARQGEFAENGRPPAFRFLDDEGHGTGSTLYVGGKGHKELCIYEKGKQLGLKDSPWTRCEARLYAKHVEVPLDVLQRPLDYLRGSYSVIGALLKGMCTRLKTMKKAVEVSAEASLQWLHRQAGPLLYVIKKAYGARWADLLETRCVREGHPGRFKRIAKGDRLIELFRSEVPCPCAS